MASQASEVKDVFLADQGRGRALTLSRQLLPTAATIVLFGGSSAS